MWEKKEIPTELYNTLLDEIRKDGKMTKRVYALFLDELERRGLFFADGAPFDTKNSAKTDGSYVYKRPHNPFWHMAHAVCAAIFKFIGWFGSGVVYGVWRVKDKKKFKNLGACITVSNHVDYLDAVLTRRALGCKKQYIVAAPHNCKNDFGGFLLTSATEIPLPINNKGARAFNDMLSYVAERKAAIHFYAEQSMWCNYKKPRPYKEGAFMYACMLDLPVVPMFYCLQEPTGLRKLLHLKKAKIKIGDTLYADKTLPPRARRKDLKDRAEREVKQIYEDFYGIALEYLCDKEKAENISEQGEQTPTGGDAR